MGGETIAEEANNKLDDGGELDDTDERERKEDDLRDSLGRVEITEANGQEGNDREVDAL